MVSYHVCHHCKSRTMTCHIDCPLYLQECEENKKRLDDIHENNNIDRTLIKNRKKRMNSHIGKGRNTHKK